MRKMVAVILDIETDYGDGLGHIRDSATLEREWKEGLISENALGVGVYRFEVPDGLDDLHARRIGWGFFFFNDWTADGTVSFVSEE